MNELTTNNRSLPRVSPYNIQRVVAERHFRLWILQENGQGFLADLHRLVLVNPDYATDGWEGWQTVQVDPEGQRLSWAHGAALDLRTLRTEARVPSLLGHIHVLSSITEADFYRPLRYCAPSAPTDSVTAGNIMSRYGIDQDTLDVITRQYAAPYELLYCRLMDLCLALGDALSMTPEGIRALMHWNWRRSIHRASERSSTPLLTIQQGDLAYVENTLYPHPGWRA
jgi:hypothetical protein